MVSPMELRSGQYFLSVIGAINYKLLSSLVAPVKPREKALVNKLTEHFTPAPSEIVERYKFHTRFRKSGESVAAFVSELCSDDTTTAFSNKSNSTVCGNK